MRVTFSSFDSVSLKTALPAIVLTYFFSIRSFLEFNYYGPCFNNQFSVLPMEALPNSLTFAVIFEYITVWNK